MTQNRTACRLIKHMLYKCRLSRYHAKQMLMTSKLYLVVHSRMRAAREILFASLNSLRWATEHKSVTSLRPAGPFPIGLGLCDFDEFPLRRLPLGSGSCWSRKIDINFASYESFRESAMNIAKLLIISTVAISLFGCSSKSKQAGTSNSDGPAMKAAGNAAAATSSASEILDRYSLSELSSAANALRVIFDKGTSAAADAPAESILDCAITPDLAKKLGQPLKSLIDDQQDRERESYTNDPALYARSHGLETCGSTCSCGALASVLKPVSAKSMKTSALKVAHERFVKRLQAKASHQTPEESLTCARKTSWFCTSELRGFLEKQVNATPGT